MLAIVLAGWANGTPLVTEGTPLSSVPRPFAYLLQSALWCTVSSTESAFFVFVTVFVLYRVLRRRGALVECDATEFDAALAIRRSGVQ